MRYLAGAVGELLVWWLDNRTRLDAAELERIASQLCRAALRGLQEAR